MTRGRRTGPYYGDDYMIEVEPAEWERYDEGKWEGRKDERKEMKDSIEEEKTGVEEREEGEEKGGGANEEEGIVSFQVPPSHDSPL